MKTLFDVLKEYLNSNRKGKRITYFKLLRLSGYRDIKPCRSKCGKYLKINNYTLYRYTLLLRRTGYLKKVNYFTVEIVKHIPKKYNLLKLRSEYNELKKQEKLYDSRI